MKPEELHVDYDSPIEVDFATNLISNMSKELADHIDEQTFHAICQAGFYIDREKMVAALKQDKRRYEEAYSRGYSKGHEDRDNQIIRCKDCEWRGNPKKCIVAFVADKQEFPFFFYDNHGEWFCADAIRREENE